MRRDDLYLNDNAGNVVSCFDDAPQVKAIERMENPDNPRYNPAAGSAPAPR